MYKKILQTSLIIGILTFISAQCYAATLDDNWSTTTWPRAAHCPFKGCSKMLTNAGEYNSHIELDHSEANRIIAQNIGILDMEAICGAVVIADALATAATATASALVAPSGAVRAVGIYKASMEWIGRLQNIQEISDQLK